MYYPKFDELINRYCFQADYIKKLDKHLASLSPQQAKRILPELLSCGLGIEYSLLLEMLIIAAEENILSYNYEAFCPVEESFLSEVEYSDNIEEYEVDCIKCQEDSHTINRRDLKVSFRLNNIIYNKPILPLFFDNLFESCKKKALTSRRGNLSIPKKPPTVAEIEIAKIKALQRDLNCNTSEATEAYKSINEKIDKDRNFTLTLTQWIVGGVVATILIPNIKPMCEFITTNKYIMSIFAQDKLTETQTVKEKQEEVNVEESDRRSP